MANKKTTTMISLDTSTTKTGYAVYRNATYIRSGVIDFSKEKDTTIRIENMVLTIYDLLSIEKADIIVTELTVVPRNANAQRMLSQILGAIWGWALTNAAEYVEYRPTKWRHLIAKENEKIPLKREDAKIWSLDKSREFGVPVDTDDESDAILIGMARIFELGTES